MIQFLRYVAVGVLNTFLGYFVIFGCMYLLGMHPVASNIAGYAVGLVVSYTLNRSYTFNSTQDRRPEILRFLAVFAIAYMLNFVALLLLIYEFGMHEGLSQVAAGVVYVGSAFLMNKYYVFKIRSTG
jgi:putative flippase GtrA